MTRIALTPMEAVIHGTPAAQAVATEAERLGARRVFVIASGTLCRETDEVEKLKASLGRSCAGVFDRMGAHVPRGDVIAATAAAREVAADLIVTIGGGSPTDGAKAVALCLANDVSTGQDIDRLLDGDVAAPAVPQISIPTTLSAGEFSAIAGVTNEATGTKDILLHPGLMPRVVVLDAEVARHTPEWLFLSTGVRAIDHCVEGICSQEANPFGDAQALHGLRLLADGLTRVKADAADLRARQDCLLGAWLSMGPLTSGVPMGASHGIGYVLGARYGIPHGHTSCLMLPAVMAWNASANADRQMLVAEALGDASEPASNLLHRLIASLGQPRGLLANGIARDAFPDIAEAALHTPWVPKNPRPIKGADDVMQILELAV
ncbi:iron-containing alcohol dehydrogenase [Puniceibacterium confluentis]|uniref:iron-containing alcohol dehydrogenase n=1 Tax=Puniceibacterium confluentis TaxID=1958944 RepID=UPI0011B6319F|nr:iron-containing alcohol dehydrogenase [Puniceibacterium confluentis]